MVLLEILLSTNNSKHGNEFELTLAKSWVASNLNMTRLKLTDTGEERPADEILNFENHRVLNEVKSTKKDFVHINLFKGHQLKSVFRFHNKFKDSVGIVTVEAHSKSEVYIMSIIKMMKMFSKTNKVDMKAFKENCDFIAYKKGDIYNLSAFNNNCLDSMKGEKLR